MDQEIVYENQRPTAQGNDRERLPSPVERKQLSEVAAGGSSVGAIAGATSAVLAIIGLAGAYPFLMTTVAAIVLGAGLFIEGTSLGAALAKLDRHNMFDETGAAGGFAFQGLAGAAGIVLGILSLIGVLPAVLIPVAIITIGGSMAFGGPSRAEVNLSVLEYGGASPNARRAATQAVHASGSLLTLVGVGAITLGILALVHVPPVGTLVLVALLVLGCALLLGDSALLGRVGLARSRR
jgi:hypothetical protein